MFENKILLYIVVVGAVVVVVVVITDLEGGLSELTMYQCKVDVDMLNTVKSVLADVRALALRQGEVSAPSHYINSLLTHNPLFALTKG